MITSEVVATRNRCVLAIYVEFTHPAFERAETAAAVGELLSRDVAKFLREQGWGWGSARVESVYPSPEYMRRPAFVPAEDESDHHRAA